MQNGTVTAGLTPGDAAIIMQKRHAYARQRGIYALQRGTHALQRGIRWLGQHRR